MIYDRMAPKHYFYKNVSAEIWIREKGKGKNPELRPGTVTCYTEGFKMEHEPKALGSRQLRKAPNCDLLGQPDSDRGTLFLQN